MNIPGWGRDTSPFHAGEQVLQDRLGLKEHQEAIGKRIFRPFMPEQHRVFFQQLPFMVMGSVDRQGWPWASMLFGEPGFVASPSNTQLSIAAQPIVGDPLADNLRPEAPLGLLGIELPTRRRNRLNGVLNHFDEQGLHLDVVQSFGNCPQYIQTRSIEFMRDPSQAFTPERETLDHIDAQTKAVIQQADTFFVASHNPKDDIRDTGGVDVSHRGGQPGFIKVEGNTLTIPDFIGNFIFNTLGNFLVNPKAGLLFVDFDSGDMLFLTGTTQVLWDPSPEFADFKGAERAWKFHFHRGYRLKGASPIRWTFGDYSRNTQLTGTWSSAKRAQVQSQQRNAWLPYQVLKIEDESSHIRSFYLQPKDQEQDFPLFAGQYLTIQVPAGEQGKAVNRTYTLSSGPGENHYRISVKKEVGPKGEQGLVSHYLHQQLKPGDTLLAQAPRGHFTFDAGEERPALLLAGGIGITPMVAMARAAATESLRARYHRPMTLIHAAKNQQERAFYPELMQLAGKSQGQLRYVSALTQIEQPQMTAGNFHASGRIDASLLQSYLPLADYDVYLCGPAGFVQAMYDLVRTLGIEDHRIFAESFGPSQLTRSSRPQQANSTESEQADEAVIHFSQSDVEQGWKKGDGDLLSFAEQHGLTPDFACRSGNCGSCAAKLQSGAVCYSQKPDFQPQDDEVLLCCAHPAKGTGVISIAI